MIKASNSAMARRLIEQFQKVANATGEGTAKQKLLNQIRSLEQDLEQCLFNESERARQAEK